MWRRVIVPLLSWLCLVSPRVAAAPEHWPQWQAFKRDFITTEGRVIDPGDPRRITTSEGQAYALFFALVGNDRDTFRNLLWWTEQHLARGDLGTHLPAWLWGLADGRQGQVLDSNSASDADLWIAYSLQEAGRLWNVHAYRVLSMQLLRLVASRQVAILPGLGPMLLPAPYGFIKPSGWYLNPSYIPLPLVLSFSSEYPDAVWPQLARTSLRLLMETTPKGFAADWIGWNSSWHGHPESGWQGGYDAIRVYLWAGMMHPDHSGREALLARLRPMAQAVARRGVPAQGWDAASGWLSETDGPLGFSAAMLPLLSVLAEQAALEQQLQRLEQYPLAADAYYDHVLALFGMGWYQGRYRFNADGSLTPRWVVRS